MKLGVLLPTFRNSADDALRLATECAEAGLDGVFAYDHLWPMGSPERPALAPLPVLARVATMCPSLVVGTLVSRIGLYGDDKIIEQFSTLSRIAPGRVIAGLGVGDAKSLAENDAYGLATAPTADRRSSLTSITEALRGEMPVWLGAGKSVTTELANELGAVLNYWQETPAETTPACAWTWAGSAEEDVSAQCRTLEDRGASWAVFTPTVSISRLKEWREA